MYRKFVRGIWGMIGIAAILAGAGCSLAEWGGGGVERDLAAFRGEWAVALILPEGMLPQMKGLVFRADGTYGALGEGGEELWGGTYDVDPAADPKRWDHRSYDADQGEDVLGIYEIDGDVMRTCVVGGRWDGETWIGKPRPATIGIEGADLYLELRRVGGVVTESD